MTDSAREYPTSKPRPPLLGVSFPQDSMVFRPETVPMNPLGGPDRGIIVQPAPSQAFGAKPPSSAPSSIGTVGSAGPSNVQRSFGDNSGDARLFAAPRPYVGGQAGPGTDTTGRWPPKVASMGQSTTIVSPTGNTVSGTGLRDQAQPLRFDTLAPDPRTEPDSKYHPQISLGPRKRR